MTSYLDFPPVSARALRGLLFDLDDTVLDHGRLHVATLATLEKLSQHGLRLCAVTGRPAGWGQVVMRQWPVDGVVAENGAIGFARSESGSRGSGILCIDRLETAERTARRAKLAQLVETLQRAFPELQLTDDHLSRYADAAFDINETHSVSQEVITAVSAVALEHGARAIRSSIHLHVSFEQDDKATGTLHFMRRVWGVSPSEALHHFAFVGDSDNDAPCFAAFQHSFGVLNLSGRPTVPPRFRASLPMGAGFCQIAEHLLRLRH